MFSIMQSEVSAHISRNGAQWKSHVEWSPIEEGSAITTATVADGYNIARIEIVEVSTGKYPIKQYANSTIRVNNLDTNK